MAVSKTRSGQSQHPADVFSFLVEGLICVVVGIISFFVMPGSICEPAIAFKGKDGSNKWWSEEEETILVNRILRDDPTKGDMNSREGISIKGLWAAFTNFDLWPVYIVRLRFGKDDEHTLTLREARHYSIYPLPADSKLSLVDSARHGLLCLYGQRVGDPGLCVVCHQHHRLCESIRKTERALLGRRRKQHLDVTILHWPDFNPHKCLTMGSLHSPHWRKRHSVHSLHSRGHDEQKRQISGHPNCFIGSLQHVLPGW